MGEKIEKRLPLYGGQYDKEIIAGFKKRLIEKGINPDYSANSVSVLNMRYFMKNQEGVALEDTKGLLARVASHVAYPEYLYSGGNTKTATRVANDFYSVMAQMEFMPNSPTLMNAGRGSGMLSACFVLPVNDSIEGIFGAITNTARIQKDGGGTGFDFSELRPTGSYIKSSGGTTSGPISFWRVFAEATNAIQQGAYRRGANMGMMSIWHPDIIKFINAKKEDGAFSNFNISVKFEDSWMKELYANPNSPFVLIDKNTGKKYLAPINLDPKKYELKDLIPYSKDADLTKAVTKHMFWSKIIENSHLNGEPGVVFIDRINRDNPTPKLGRIEATNPCGEQPLLPYEACNLGSINLAKMMTADGKLDEAKLRRVTRIGTRFLDNVIDMNNLPLPQITEMVAGNRKIGLGVMGFADYLYAARIPYDSEQAIEVGGRMMEIITEESMAMSRKLAKERGSFPNISKSIYAGTLMRNATTTTIAPTGTISIIANTSGGIEPRMAGVYAHRDGEGNIRFFYDEGLLKDLNDRGLDGKKILDTVFKEGIHLDEIKEVPRDIANSYRASHDISVENQIKMQAAFQRHTHNAVSKTINLPMNAPITETEKAFKLAHEQECKGVTVYRNGSRKGQVIVFSQRELDGLESVVRQNNFTGTIDSPMKVPEMMPAVRIRQDTPYGHIHTTVVCDPSNNYKVHEVFGFLGNAGTEEAATMEALGRGASLYLRSGGKIEKIIDQMIDIGSGASKTTRSGQVNSLSKGFAKSMLKFVVAREHFDIEDLMMGRVNYDKFSGAVSDYVKKIENKEEIHSGQDLIAQIKPEGPKTIEKNNGTKKAFAERCPECGKGIYIFSEGCMKCNNPKCGHSKC